MNKFSVVFYLREPIASGQEIARTMKSTQEYAHPSRHTYIIYICIYIYTHFEDIITSFNHLCSRNCNEHGKKLHHDVENIKFPRSNKSMVIYSRTSHRFTIDAFTDALQMQVISLRISVTRCKIYYS